MALQRAILVAALLSAATAPPLLAQITSVDPFSGARSEGFETQPVGVTDCVVGGVFQGTGVLCTPQSVGVNLTTQWDFLCSASPRSGSQFCGSLDGPLEFVFDPPVLRFGGYFTTNANAGTVTARLFEAGGNELSVEALDVPADCSWRWNGWASAGRPIARIVLRSDVFGGAFVQLDDLELDPPSIGTRYCSAGINSTGDSARIDATGSTSIASGDLVLLCEAVPPGNTALFFYGAGQASAPFGNGTRCVSSGGVGLRRFPNLRADPSGRVLMQVDYGTIPQSPTLIQAGSSWSFQTLFRDPAAGGARFDLSDALTLSFVP